MYYARHKRRTEAPRRGNRQMEEFNAHIYTGTVYILLCVYVCTDEFSKPIENVKKKHKIYSICRRNFGFFFFLLINFSV